MQSRDRVRCNDDSLRLAQLFSGRPAVDLKRLVADLTLEEAIPNLATLRCLDACLRKRAIWERAWEVQRREDPGEKLGISVPLKYAREDLRERNQRPPPQARPSPRRSRPCSKEVSPRPSLSRLAEL